METSHAFHTARSPTEEDRGACAVLAQALADGSDEAEGVLEVGWGHHLSTVKHTKYSVWDILTATPTLCIRSTLTQLTSIYCVDTTRRRRELLGLQQCKYLKSQDFGEQYIPNTQQQLG